MAQETKAIERLERICNLEINIDRKVFCEPPLDTICNVGRRWRYFRLADEMICKGRRKIIPGTVLLKYFRNIACGDLYALFQTPARHCRGPRDQGGMALHRHHKHDITSRRRKPNHSFTSSCSKIHWGTDITSGYDKASYKQRITHFTEELSFLSEEDKDWVMGKSILERLSWA